MEEHKERLIWSAEAEDDLLSIWRYGAETWSPPDADNHLREITHACERLLTEPKLGEARDELVAGLRSILVKPHITYYRITSIAVEIARVVHESEDTAQKRAPRDRTDPERTMIRR
jgi:toxin ParE1/3/4